MTCSIGVAISPGDSGDPRELVDIAERRVHEAKNAGRNTVSI